MLIFFDIDGVMHPVRSRRDAYMSCRPCFERWAGKNPEVRFVITSSWRQLYPLEVLRGYFSEAIQSRIIDTTPRLYGTREHARYQEILSWLKTNDAMDDPWLALDDSYSEFPAQFPQLVRCMPDRGFDDAVALELDRRLAGTG